LLEALEANLFSLPGETLSVRRWLGGYTNALGKAYLRYVAQF